MSLPRYPKYKDSKCDWFRTVPTHWDVSRLKLSVSLVTEKTDRRSNPIALENIEGWSGKFVPTETEFAGDGVAFGPGDILFGKLRPYLAKAYLADSAGEAVGDFHVLRPMRTLVPRFLQYLVLSRGFIAMVDGSTFGSKMPRVSWEFLANMLLAVPPRDEQSAIVAFLDRETSKIDTLIAEQEKLLVLLAEKRQATVSHAVTRGLNPDAPMKDSGVKWLGEVPAHWEVKRLKTISPFITVGIVVNPSDYVSEEGLPFIYGGDISEGKISLDTCRKIRPEDSRKQPKTMLEAGDLLTVRVGAPGVTAVVPETCDGGNCASVMLVRKGSFDSTWLCYAMNSRMVRFQVEVVQYGAAQEQFNISHAINFWIATPPRSEQADVATFLERETSKLDALREGVERAIALLKERRSALITAAVTGKIDVRNAVPQELAA